MKNNVLFEIGLEELPARFIDDAENQLLNKTKQWLDENRIEFETVRSYSTPRRLAVLIGGVESMQQTITEEVKGPSKKVAVNEDGEWTKAAIGFTKGQGKTVDDIYIKEINGTPYIFVSKTIEGKETINLLPEFQNIIMSIQFPQTMRWGTEDIKYARPIRWLVALYNDQIIPFEIAHVKTSNETYGHRFLGKKINLDHCTSYEHMLEDNYVIIDKHKREEMIVQQIKHLEEQENFRVNVDDDLLREVCNLVEYPTAFFGSFDESYLSLPSEVLITSMREHQRYFPVQSEQGQLLPYFVSVRNGDSYEINTVVKGNEKVLRARLADGQFFYEEDLKHSINFYIDKLERVIFQEKLGSVKDKVIRVKEVAKQIGQLLEVDQHTMEKILRAASICKFDLVTNMVNEFTELQGVIGEKYATFFGEEEEVALAIKEHYMPLQASGALPSSLVGSIISIADKLDTITGFISVGILPSGSQDPYGLRRQAIGLLRILADKKWDISFEQLLNMSLYQFNLNQTDDHIHELKDFFKSRALYILREMKIEQDVILAVFDEKIGDFSFAIDKAKVLSAKRNDEQFKLNEEALVRILNLAENIDESEVQPQFFQTESERELYEQYVQTVPKYKEAISLRNAEESLEQLADLAPFIHTFFDHNMVMDENEHIRKNRQALVKNISLLIKEYANLALIQWKQHA